MALRQELELMNTLWRVGQHNSYETISSWTCDYYTKTNHFPATCIIEMIENPSLLRGIAMKMKQHCHSHPAEQTVCVGSGFSYGQWGNSVGHSVVNVAHGLDWSCGKYQQLISTALFGELPKTTISYELKRKQPPYYNDIVAASIIFVHGAHQ